MIGIYLSSLVLLGLSGVLLDWHRRSWRAAESNSDLPAHERRFALAQYRRRMQASGIIGLLGAAIGLSPLVPREPWPMVIYLLVLCAACGNIMLLAALDAWATQQFYARIRTERLAAQIKLAREIAAASKSTKDDR